MSQYTWIQGAVREQGFGGVGIKLIGRMHMEEYLLKEKKFSERLKDNELINFDFLRFNIIYSS